MKFNAILFLVILASCSTGPHTLEKVAIHQVDSMSSCAYLTRDRKGSPVLLYVAELNDSVSALRFCRIDIQGNPLAPVSIPRTNDVIPHNENLPKIIFKPSGEILAMWCCRNPNPKNKYSGMIRYTQSFDNGTSWTEPMLLVTDTSSHDQRYFDIAVLPDGEAGAIWLDSRGNGEGSALYFARSAGKSGFKNEQKVMDNICPCCRTRLFVDGKGSINLSFRAILNDSIRDMVLVSSANGGKNFSAAKRISADNWVVNGCPHTGPAIAENSEGLQFAWYTGGSPEGLYYCSSKSGAFTTRDSIREKASAKHPQLIAMENGELCVAWDENTKNGNAVNTRVGFQRRDKKGNLISTHFISDESIVAEFPALLPLNNERILVAYTQRSGVRKSIQTEVLELK
jgi:hypothetical protein